MGTELRANGELRLTRFTTDDIAQAIDPATVARAFASLSIEKPFEHSRLAFTAAGGVVGSTGALPAQEWLYFGGPVSAPGYAFHKLGAVVGATTRLEWRMPVPAPSISLGRFGRIPGQATLAPFVQGTFARRGLIDATHPAGIYPSAGLAVQPFFDLMRIQVARGLRHGGWSLNVDVTRDFWSIL